MSGSSELAINLWDLVPAVTGGIIGALAGGIPAWMLAKKQSEETLKRDKAARALNEHALAFKVSVKLMTIINNIIHDWCHFQRALALRADPETAHMEPWQALQPLVGFTDEDATRFEADELALFMAAKRADFVSELLLLAQRHATSIAVMKEYYGQREALKAHSPHPEKLDGEIAIGTISEEERLGLLPYTIPLNGMAIQMAEGVEENLELARNVTLAIGPIFDTYFGKGTVGHLSFPTEAELIELVWPST